jgi:hypothetical protein
MKIHAMTTVIALSGVLAAGCAGTGLRLRSDEAAQRYIDYAGTPIERFTAFDLDSWTPVAKNKLVVWNGVNEAYLITVWDSCENLLFANSVGVTSTGRTISKFEQVRVRRDRCPISEIRPVDVRQMKADRAAARAKQ